MDTFRICQQPCAGYCVELALDVGSAAFVFLLIFTAVHAVPAVRNAVRWTIAGDDPVALTDVGIGSELTQQRLEVELSDAVSTEDTDLAASFVELANQQGLRVPTATQN